MYAIYALIRLEKLWLTALRDSLHLPPFCSRMDLQVSVFLLATLLLVKCENTTNTVPESNTIEAKISTSKPANVCTVCACADAFVNCSSRHLENHFADFQWPDTTIKEILFDHNDLVHVIPFPKIIVEKLILRYNKISVIDYHAFKELVNLTELDLSHNQLTSEFLQPQVFEGKFSPEAYEPLSNLKILNLAGNILHWLHQDLFEHITGIKVLNLSGNPFGAFEYRTSIAISSLPYLEELDISFCQLKELPYMQFQNSRYLKKLDLTNNKLTVLPRPLEGAKALEYLRLDANPIPVIDRTNAFPKLTNLKELSLRKMPNLTEIGNGGLSALTGLQNLYVQNCEKLEKIDEYAIASRTAEGTIWPPLKILNLESNALRYLPILLGMWEKLEKLHLRHNQWSCDCRNQYLIEIILQEHGNRLMGDEVHELTCSAPPEHAKEKLTSLFGRHMRCLDLYDARPEKDSAILVGVLIGLLIAIPLTMAFFTFWRRGFFFCGTQGPATFSRAFYKRASNDDEI